MIWDLSIKCNWCSEYLIKYSTKSFTNITTYEFVCPFNRYHGIIRLDENYNIIYYFSVIFINDIEYNLTGSLDDNYTSLYLCVNYSEKLIFYGEFIPLNIENYNDNLMKLLTRLLNLVDFC